MISKKEIQSLIFLLDDPDPFVNQSVEKRLFELGENAVPLLDEFRLDLKDHEERVKVSDIIHKITFDTLQSDFLDVLENGVNNRHDLEYAALTLARFGTPTLRAREYSNKLDHFAEMVDSSIRYKLDERRKMQHFIKFIFEDLNFKGDIKDYHSPLNGYVDKVIDRRIGLPITLSMIAMFIARRLDLPFYGINMPIHFMLTFVGEKEEVLIDPYDKGAMVTYDQCYFFLKKNNIEPRPEHFQMASNMDILIRCIRNLIESYERNKMLDKVEDLQKLLVTAELFSHK